MEVGIEVVDMEAVDTEVVDTGATQEAASTSRASIAAEEQKKLYRYRTCLQAICSTLRMSLVQLIPVAITMGQPTTTGAGNRIKLEK